MYRVVAVPGDADGAIRYSNGLVEIDLSCTSDQMVVHEGGAATVIGKSDGLDERISALVRSHQLHYCLLPSHHRHVVPSVWKYALRPLDLAHHFEVVDVLGGDGRALFFNGGANYSVNQFAIVGQRLLVGTTREVLVDEFGIEPALVGEEINRGVVLRLVGAVTFLRKLIDQHRLGPRLVPGCWAALVKQDLGLPQFGGVTLFRGPAVIWKDGDAGVAIYLNEVDSRIICWGESVCDFLRRYGVVLHPSGQSASAVLEPDEASRRLLAGLAHMPSFDDQALRFIASLQQTVSSPVCLHCPSLLDWLVGGA